MPDRRFRETRSRRRKPRARRYPMTTQPPAIASPDSHARMRILVVTSQFPIAGEPNRGRPIYQTVRELAQIADVKVISAVATYPRWARPRSYLFRPHDADHRVDGVETEYVSYPALPLVTRPFNGALCSRAIAASARAYRPDVILGYWLYPDAYAGMHAARRLGVPLVAGALGSDLLVRDRWTQRLTRPVLREAQRLLVVSDDLGKAAERAYGADPARVRVIPNGCDASIFHPRERAGARAALGVPGDAELILYVGRLVAEKGLRELLEAARALVAERPSLRVALAGEGPLQDELRQRLAADPGLPVQLLGAQSPHQVAQWLAAANLLTLPSYSEGHPNVLVESLACGRAVVATRVGGIPEFIDADCGVLIPPRDAVALTAGLRRGLDTDWDEIRLARRFSRTWGEVAADTLQACREAVASHRAG